LKTNKIFLIIVIHIFLIAVNWLVALYIYDLLKNDAKQINQMGQIRGGIQLISKEYLLEKVSQNNVNRIDNLIDTITTNKNTIFDNKNEEPKSTLITLQIDWKQFKSLLNCETVACNNQIIKISDRLWNSANRLTLLLQKSSEEKLNFFNYIFILLLLDILLIAVAIYLIYSLINPAIDKERRELKKYLNVIDKNIITSSTDLNGIITHASKAFCKISGYSKEELIGKNHNIIRHPDMPKKTFENLWKKIKSNQTWNGEVKNLKKDGGYYWVEASISTKFNDNGEAIGYTAIRQDITDKKRIEELSVKDPMTNLYNRRKFNEVLETELYRIQRHNKDIKNGMKADEINLYLFSIDVDFFKQYNDTYGHDKGDETLITIANVLQEHTKRHSDWTFRLGGEEFGFLMSSTDDVEKAMEYANKIRVAIEDIKILNAKSTVSKYVTISVGISVANDSCKYDKDLLYKRSDIALYQAKNSGRNSCEFFE